MPNGIEGRCSIKTLKGLHSKENYATVLVGK